MKYKTIYFLVVAGLVSGLAFADCQAIIEGCHDRYVQEATSCNNIYDQEQQDDCIRRANEQYEYCVKSVNC